MTFTSRNLQKSPSFTILYLHIRASSQVLFDGFDISFFNSIVN